MMKEMQEVGMALPAEVVFDALIGWDRFYPPSDAAVDEQYEAACPEIQNVYNQQGVWLEIIPPGDSLWDNGPKAHRWTIGLHPDWWVDYDPALRALGCDTLDESKEWAQARALADAVEFGCDQALEEYLDEHPDLNEQIQWHADEFGFYLTGS